MDIRNVLAIDPSYRNLGFAVFTEDGEIVQYGLVQPAPDLKCKLSKEDKLDFPARSLHMYNRLIDSIDNMWMIKTVLIELPQQFRSKRGQVGLDSEAVQKLYFLVGQFAGSFLKCGIKVKYFRPSKWKGNIPKEITMKRVNRDYGLHIENHNVSDAVGIGRYFFQNAKKGGTKKGMV